VERLDNDSNIIAGTELYKLPESAIKAGAV
jgi:uncharacterized protein YegP (UPF0339 family)